MSFEIHLATITTGSLSFGLKNPWVFWKVEFFRAWVFPENVKKKPELNLREALSYFNNPTREKFSWSTTFYAIFVKKYFQILPISHNC